MRRTGLVTVGIEFRRDGVHVAFVGHRNATVLGLGLGPYPPGTVVDGDVRQVEEAGRALADLLGQVHWGRDPALVIAVPPGDRIDGRATVTAPVAIGTSVGRVRAVARHVDTAVETVADIPVAAVAVETAATAVHRFALAAGLAPGLVFARGTTGHRQWTMCAGNSSLEVETSTAEPGPAIVIGPDLGLLLPPRWGVMTVVDRVRRAYPEPGRFTVAVGAALAGADLTPFVDLNGPTAQRTDSTNTSDWWGVETIS